jgi:hypothetical protein
VKEVVINITQELKEVVINITQELKERARFELMQKLRHQNFGELFPNLCFQHLTRETSFIQDRSVFAVLAMGTLGLNSGRSLERTSTVLSFQFAPAVSRVYHAVPGERRFQLV